MTPRGTQATQMAIPLRLQLRVRTRMTPLMMMGTTATLPRTPPHSHSRRPSNQFTLSKVDLKSAFRLCPVHPGDWQLLGIHWQGRYVLLRSAPYLFNMVADTIQWILHCHFQVSNSFHYLDDFSSLGQPTPRPVTLQFQTCSCFAMHYKPH